MKLRASSLALIALFVCADVARADDLRPSGAITASLLASPEGDFGGSLGGDLWIALGIFRVGGFFGAGVIPSDDDTRNRVMMPLAASVGIEVLGDTIGFSARLRGGMWGGATQGSKLTAGGFFGGGTYFLVRLGPEAALAIGLDVWGVIGDGDTVLIAPGAGLTWTPATGLE